MVKNIIIGMAVLCTVAFVSSTARADKAKYVGVKMCMPCHRGAAKGMQAEIWEKSAHAKAFKTLESPEADKIAKTKGLKTAAKDAPECLKCHTTDSAHASDGVGCETCHGPGSEYKTMAIMKDKAKAVAAGLVIAENDPKLCQRCHNSESPTFKGFDYKAMWDKIKHPIPKK